MMFSDAPTSLQRPSAVRPEPAFTSTNGWDVVDAAGDVAALRPMPGEASSFGPVLGTPQQPSQSGGADSSFGRAPSSMIDQSDSAIAAPTSRDDHEGATAEHVSAVFCTTNGRQSLRSTAEYGAVDTLRFLHTVAGATHHLPVRYPYKATGLPEATDALFAATRIGFTVIVDGFRIGGDTIIARSKRLDLRRGILTCDELRVTPDPETLLRVRCTRFASVADPDHAFVRLDVALVPATSPPGHGDPMSPTATSTHDLSIEAEIGFDPKRWAADAAPADDPTQADRSSTSKVLLTVRPLQKGGAAVVPPPAPTHVGVTFGAKGCGAPSVCEPSAAGRPPTPLFDVAGACSSDAQSTSGYGTAAFPRGVASATPKYSTLCRRTMSSAPALGETVTLAMNLSLRPAEAAAAVDFVKSAQEHHDALERLWGVAASTNALDVETQLTRAKGNFALASALRHGHFMLLANAAGVGDRVHLTRSGLTAGGSGGLCDLTALCVQGAALLYSDWASARNIVSSLVAMLPEARRNAANQSVRGCLFPARTVNGADSVSYFVNSAPRVYISCDVALLALDFVRATEGGLQGLMAQDHALAAGIGALVVETAAAVLDYGTWDAVAGAFRLDSVTGPDEYNPLVDDHVYTLAAARSHLRRAAALLQEEPQLLTVPVVQQALLDAGVQGEELRALMARAANAIVIPRDDATRVYHAHSCFDKLPPFPSTSIIGRPLSVHVHPLVIYRHKVVQVPDTLLAMLLHPGQFFPGELRAALEYYRPFCSRDEPWAMAVEAAADLRAYGDTSREGPALLSTLIRLTLDRSSVDSTDGLSLAPIAASWFAIVHGLLGFVHPDESPELCFAPVLPVGWTRVAIPFTWRHTRIVVEVTSRAVTYRHVSGPSIRLRHGGSSGCGGDGTPVCLSARTREVNFPRGVCQPVAPCFDGVIVLLDAVVDGFHEANYEAWRRVLHDFATVVQYTTAANARAIDNSPPPSGEALDAMAPAAEAMSLDEYAETFLGPATADALGQKHYAGLDQVLSTRGLDIPLGATSDAVVSHTRYGLANAKLAELKELVRDNQAGLSFVDGAVPLLRSLAREGIRTAVVTFSRSAPDMLAQLPEVSSSIVATIDGTEARNLGISGRPHANLFTTAAERLHLDPGRCVVLGSQLHTGYLSDAFDPFAAAINVGWDHDRHSPGPAGSTTAKVLNIDRTQMPHTAADIEELAFPDVA